MPENEAATPQIIPPMVTKPAGTGHQKAFWALVVIILISVVGAGAYWFGQRTNSPASLTCVNPTPAPSLTSLPSASPSPTVSVSPVPSVIVKPVVTFEAQGAIPEADLKQLNSRIVNPVIGYYQENPTQAIVSLTISPNDKPSKNEFPYLGSIVFKNGGNSGFVISKKNGEIGWWGPDCMICTFSAEYKTKYPEITENY